MIQTEQAKAKKTHTQSVHAKEYVSPTEAGRCKMCKRQTDGQQREVITCDPGYVGDLTLFLTFTKCSGVQPNLSSISVMLC